MENGQWENRGKWNEKENELPNLNFFLLASSAWVLSLCLSFAFNEASNAALALGSVRASNAFVSSWNIAAEGDKILISKHTYQLDNGEQITTAICPWYLNT